MSLTKIQWLKRPGLFRCILVEADYLEAGELKTLHLSNYPFRAKPTDVKANQVYHNWLNVGSTLTFSQRMSVVLFGETTTSTSAIEFFLHEKVEALITSADFSGQKIRVLIGAPKWSRDLFIEKFVGVSKNIDPVDDNRARLLFSDFSKSLTKPVLTNAITSVENNDVFKPRCFGQCFNIEPVLTNAISRTYQINDGAIESVTQVRESGFVISPVNYTVNKSVGTITINKNVTGRLTLDCQGHVENGVYLKTAEQIINHLLFIAGQSAAVDSLVLPSYTLGLYQQKQRNIDECIDEVCQSVGANWYFDALSQFRLQHYVGITPVTDFITAGQIKNGSLRIKDRLPAISKLTLAFQKNYTPQGDGLAAVITENNPELAALYQKDNSVSSGTNTVVNSSAAEELIIPTLIANLADVQTELVRRLPLLKHPRTIYSMETTIKKHNQGSTVNVTYPRYFGGSKDAVVVGQIHRLNNPTDIMEVLA